MKKIVKKIYHKLNPVHAVTSDELIGKYIQNGRIPWSPGYELYKWKSIKDALDSDSVLQSLGKGRLNPEFGIGLDERIVEYPWIFSLLGKGTGRLLDAGSTFNFETILDQDRIKSRELSIYTFHPEHRSFNERKISYLYGDLRCLPFRDNWFDEVVCQSTIEHIDMDNSIYGYDLKGIEEPRKKSYEYLKVVEELIRVTQKGGQLLISFPYGRFENHGFFQQFDREMLGRIEEMLKPEGKFELAFFRYFKDGWKMVKQEECDTAESFNPHTGAGKGEDGAAHCRGICGIKFIKA
ncbi:MAG: methyltransferase domain-containing protein [Bacteroidia bacterium]